MHLSTVKALSKLTLPDSAFGRCRRWRLFVLRITVGRPPVSIDLLEHFRAKGFCIHGSNLLCQRAHCRSLVRLACCLVPGFERSATFSRTRVAVVGLGSEDDMQPKREHKQHNKRHQQRIAVKPTEAISLASLSFTFRFARTNNARCQTSFFAS